MACAVAIALLRKVREIDENLVLRVIIFRLVRLPGLRGLTFDFWTSLRLKRAHNTNNVYSLEVGQFYFNLFLINS